MGRRDPQCYVPGKENLLFTSVHEVWPGHFLNFLQSNGLKSVLGNFSSAMPCRGLGALFEEDDV